MTIENAGDNLGENVSGQYLVPYQDCFGTEGVAEGYFFVTNGHGISEGLLLLKEHLSETPGCENEHVIPVILNEHGMSPTLDGLVPHQDFMSGLCTFGVEVSSSRTEPTHLGITLRNFAKEDPNFVAALATNGIAPPELWGLNGQYGEMAVADDVAVLYATGAMPTLDIGYLQ